MVIKSYKVEKHKRSKKLDGKRPEYNADNRDSKLEPKYENFKGDPIL